MREDSAERMPFVISEVESSLSFVNVEFVVCTALLLFNQQRLLKTPVAGFALFIAFVFFLFGGLSFAVAGGEMARGPRGVSAAGKALELGNVCSEWFGMYMVILAMPVIVQTTALKRAAGGVGLAVTLAGYTVYVLSRYDLLGRFLVGPPRIWVHIAFGALIVTQWLSVAWNYLGAQYLSGLAYAVLTVSCALLHYRRGEFRVAAHP